MRKSSLVVSAIVLFAFALCASLAYADALVAKVQFPFKAGGIEYPAGTYRIETIATMESLKILHEETTKSGIVPFLTRLSEREGEKGMLVFDKVGDQCYLSEIYIPGIDGFEVKAAAGKHTHVKVIAGKK